MWECATYCCWMFPEQTYPPELTEKKLGDLGLMRHVRDMEPHEVIDGDQPYRHDAETLPPEAWEVEVDRGAGRWGITVDLTGAGLQIVRLEPGAIWSYNVSAEPYKAFRPVQKNDFITAVNGVTNTHEMFQAMKDQRRLTLKIVRPIVFTARLMKAKEPLGLELSHKEGLSTCIEIVEVLETGAIGTRNASTPDSLRIRAKDFIEAVNGTSGSADRLRDRLRLDADLELRLLRVPPNGMARI